MEYPEPHTTTWEHYVIGTMDRGHGLHYPCVSKETANVPNDTSRMSWLVLFVHGTHKAIADVLLRHTVVDTIDQNTVCIKLLRDPVLLNEGNQPAIQSTAASIKAPVGKWFHFPDVDVRNEYYPVLEEMQTKYGEVYVVASLHPLELVLFPSRATIEELTRTKSEDVHTEKL